MYNECYFLNTRHKITLEGYIYIYIYIDMFISVCVCVCTVHALFNLGLNLSINFIDEFKPKLNKTWTGHTHKWK